jgi:TPR repeat protein
MRLVVFILALLLAPCLARAEMQYLSDPVYRQLNPDDPPPMQDMEDLAKGGDVRAMFILGNLYAKGQAGLPKDEKKAQYWYERSAALGAYESLVRLGALARKRKDQVEAYKWYSLAAQYMSGAWAEDAEARRAAIANDKSFSAQDIDRARKEMNVWRSEARRLRAEEEQRQKEAAKAEKQAKQEETKKP